MNIVLGSNYESIVSETKRLANKTSVLKSKLLQIRTKLDDAYDGQIDYDTEIKVLEKRLYTQQIRMSNLSSAVSSAFDGLLTVDSKSIEIDNGLKTILEVTKSTSSDTFKEISSGVKSIVAKYKDSKWADIISSVIPPICAGGVVIGGAVSVGKVVADVISGVIDETTDTTESVTINESYNIPQSQSKEVIPYKTNSEEYRCTYAYNEVINSFDVENNKRYKKGNGKTWCNIYVWDVTTAMGCEIPHYYDIKTGAPLTRDYCLSHKGEYYEMSARRMTSWLESYGRGYGWIECDAETAIKMANSGLPTVVAATDTSHVGMVAPQAEGESGVMISQAGAKNYSHTKLKNGFGSHSVKYFYHY